MFFFFEFVVSRSLDILERCTPGHSLLTFEYTRALEFGSGRIVRGKNMHEGVFQTGLMRHLSLQSCGGPGRVVDGRATEDVVQDQRPAGSAFVVLPQPSRELVEVQKPRSLLVPRECLGVQLRKMHL